MYSSFLEHDSTPYPHYVRKSCLSEQRCKNLIERLESSVELKADPEGQLMLDLPLEGNVMLYRRMWSISDNVNRHSWQFDITGWQQPLRVSRYTVGDGMDWHQDYINSDTSKIAFSVALNNDYEGGQLLMLETPSIPKPGVGNATFFPAYHGHKVNPIRSGDRYVLLGWLTGPRFR